MRVLSFQRVTLQKNSKTSFWTSNRNNLIINLFFRQLFYEAKGSLTMLSGTCPFMESSMPEKISRFACLVRDMREAQKLYFHTRDKADLKKAKALEEKVDATLAEMFSPFRGQQERGQCTLL